MGFYNNNNSNTDSNGKPPWILNINNLPYFGQAQKMFKKPFWSRQQDKKSRDSFKVDYAPRGPFNDNVDRLNSKWVPGVLMFFVATIQILSAMEPSVKQTHPGLTGAVWCLRSPELSNDEYAYALDYCQTKTHYYIPAGKSLHWANVTQMHRAIGYYHWVQVVLTLQAGLFIVPYLLWIQISKSGGVNYGSIIAAAERLGKMRLNDAERHRGVRQLSATLLEIYIPEKLSKPRRFFGCHLGRSSNFSIAVIYVMFKFVYLLITVVTFVWLNIFIGDTGRERWWGWTVLKQWMGNENWQESAVFPRVTFCNVPIRRLGDTPHYTLQCHLRINTYNEKIFLFIWWLFLYAAMATLMNFLCYVGAFLCFSSFSVSTVRHLLTQKEFEKKMASRNRKDEKMVENFAMEQLGYEGILLLCFIQNNAGSIVTRDICAHLFSKYSRIRLRPRYGYQANEQAQEKNNGNQMDDNYDEEEREMNFWYGESEPEQNEQQQDQQYCTFNAPDFQSVNDLNLGENAGTGKKKPSTSTFSSFTGTSSSSNFSGPFQFMRRAFGRKKRARRHKKTHVV